MSKQFALPFNPIEWPALPHDFTGDNNLGLSTSDTVPRYVAGTRHLAWDGSVYKYGKASAVMTSYQAGAKFTDTAADVTYAAMPIGAGAGSREVTVTLGTAVEDLYQGGLLTIFYSGTGDGTTFLVQGNDATNGTTTKLYLDRPVPAAVIATTHSMELFPNPYMAIAQNSSTGESVVGPPMAIIASSSFGWFKTRGPAFISAQANVGVAYTQAAYWRHDGSVDVGTSAGAAFVTDQYAGYSLSDGVTAGPLIMLQGSF